MRSKQTLHEKVVVITGAAGGIGRATALAFARQGAYLALLDQSEAGLNELADHLRSAWTSVQVEKADLSSSEGVRTGIQAVLAPYHQQVDILVANVGVLVAGRFADITDAQLEDGLTMNFLTHVWACRTVLPLMAGREGANIILVGSDQGSQPDAGLFPYAQAKAALHSFAKGLAREYGPTIRVNAIAPGMCRTPLVEGLMERLAREEGGTDPAMAEQLEIQRRAIPSGRLGDPEEVADAIVFLAQNGFCTGSILALDGGNTRGV